MKKQNLKFIVIILMVVVFFQITRFNTISFTSDTENTNTKNTVEEIESLRERNVKHFKFPDGTVKMVAYPYPVHNLNKNGIWSEISNELIFKDNEYKTENNRISFEKELNNNCKLFSLNENGRSVIVSLNVDNINNVSAKIENQKEKYIVDEKDELEVQYEKLKSVNNTSKVKYEDIVDNVDLEYILFANNVKENIIIHSNDLISYNFEFTINLNGLKPYLDEYGNVLLLDFNNNRVVYRIPAPFMYDANGVRSNDVKYELKNEGEKTHLTIVADSDWINAEERCFPVIIDPTIVEEDSYCIDTYINSDIPANGYYYSETLWVSPTKWTFVKPEIPDLPNNAILVSAQLNLYYYYYDTVNSGYLMADIFGVDQYLNYYIANWNNASNIARTYCRSILMYAYENDAKLNNPKLISADITDFYNTLQSDPDAEYNGFLIKRYNGTNGSVIIKSYEASDYNAAYVTVTYKTDNLQIIEDGVYWLSSRASLGPNGRRRLMDVEGNSANNLTEIQQWDSVNPSNDKYRAQLFYIKYCGSNVYRIYTYSNPNYCIALNYSNHKLVSSSDVFSGYSKWIIQGNSNTGYTIENYNTSEVICVPESINNGLPLELVDNNTNVGNRNKWILNRFDGYELSIVSEFALDGSVFAPTGHSFLIFKNTSTHPVKVGYITVLPGNIVTLGTYGILSGSGSSGGSNNNEGIFYNRDLYEYDNSQYNCKGYALTMIINDDDLRTINYNYLRNPTYNNWQLQGNDYSNCSHFAQMVWNSATGINVNGYDSNWFVYTPLKLRQSITNYQWYIYPVNNLPSTSWYGIYNDATGQFEYCYNVNSGNEALPNVPTN